MIYRRKRLMFAQKISFKNKIASKSTGRRSNRHRKLSRTKANLGFFDSAQGRTYKGAMIRIYPLRALHR